MVKVFLSKVIVMSILVCSMAFASCSSDVPTAPNEEETGNPQQPGDTEGSVSTVKFSLDFNSLSRANIPVDLDKYDVKVYVYQAVSTAKGISLGVVASWDQWSSFESSEYKLFVEDKYNGTPLNFELPELKIPGLSLGAEAERYQYKIVVIASTRNSGTLPVLGGDSSKKIDGQFTNPVGEGAESIEIFKDYFFIKNSDSDSKPDKNDKLDFSGLIDQGKYDEDRKTLKAVLTRKSGEVQVTVMKNASEIITNLLQAKTIDVTISGAASAIGFEPKTSPVDSKTGLSYDVNLNGTATIKKSFPVDFNKKEAEVLLLESLPKYIYEKGADSDGIELKLEFKNESGDIINSISVVPEKQFYIFPNTRSTITLGKSGFEFGNDINLDDDDWDGIH